MTTPPIVIAFLGMQELLILGAIVLLLFGARKLPELARAAGSSITQFKKGLKDDEEGGKASIEGGDAKSAESKQETP